MEPKSREEIRAALDKMKEPKDGTNPPDYVVPKAPAKKGNKNRIRKQGV